MIQSDQTIPFPGPDHLHGAPSAGASTHSRAHLLIIDDEPLLGVCLRRILRSDFEVHQALSVPAALALLQAGQHFDVILCDLLLPGPNGMAFHRDVARTAPELAQRIVFMTGGSTNPTLMEFLATVDNPCLDKPFEARELRRVILQTAALVA